MSEMTLPEIAKAMRKIDICMMTTRQADGGLESRPMSNNKDVDYNGDSWFFAHGDASAVEDLENDPRANLSFIGHKGLLGHDLYIGITGKGELIRDKAVMKQHWVKDLEIWFEDGLDTPGLTLIHIKAGRLKYWNGMDEGEIGF